MTMNRFEDRVALVTGAANGIGRATMERLAGEGATVVAVDHEAGDLADAVGPLKDEGRNVTAVVADVMEESGIEAAFATLDDMPDGRLDASIHIAGNSMFGTIEDLASDDWERLWRLNVLSTVICCRLAVRRMKRVGGGAIVNMSSISGLAGDPGWGAYNAAKAAIWNLTQCLAWEVGRYNIRANAICPGPIGTPRMLGSLEAAPEQAAAYARSTPLGRIGTPEECAAAICFLASDDASFVNSTMLVCDGGLTGVTGQPRFDMDSYSFAG
ncbi:MAG: SDR family oxidoreductase [Alphaproteobacteria bacterium]|nr:SDR family oxidoreductase [Alphaproteobacteria bacterium]